MKKAFFFATLLSLSIVLIGCSSNQDSESPQNTETSITEEATAEPTEPTLAPSSEESSTPVPDQEPSDSEQKETSNNLEEYLSDYPDSLSYHLLYDIALNANATTTQDENVTYMFGKDDSGNRILGTVMAYYTNLSGYENLDVTTFCQAYITDRFPELETFLQSAEIHDTDGIHGEIMNFEDYKITLIPDNDFSGMTVSISKNQE